MIRMPALTLGVLVLVFGAQVLCSPETQPGSSLDQTISPSDKIEDADQGETRQIQKRAPSYDFGLGKKRAYTYVSEYKRLPVYNFGLGKRSPAYEFGLGKRPHPESEEDVDLEDEDASWNNQMMEQDEEPAEWSPEDEELYDVDPKRARPYSFGLGKRLSPDSEGYPKRLSKGYEFGLGKRSPYEFGLGKRSPYEFGLGKRSPYEFGLGKRSPYEFGLGKRSPYEFGLGKRSPYEFGLGKKAYEFGLGKKAYEFGLGKRAAYEFGLGKRGAAYEFGLGKKAYDYDSGKKSDSLGKRLPGGNYKQLYEFGLGRRRRDLMSQDQQVDSSSSQD